MDALFFVAVIQKDIETAGHGDHQLMQRLVRVPAAFGTSGDVVKVIDPFDVEGDMPPFSMKVRFPRGSVILGRSMILQSWTLMLRQILCSVRVL